MEELQKMIAFDRSKNFDLLKLSFRLPKLANFCLHKSIESEFYPFIKKFENWLQKIMENKEGGLSLVFTRKTIVGETFTWKLKNLCKSIFGIDASQLCSYSRCQTMSTRLYTRWDLDTGTNKFSPRENKTRSFEN